jgi:hypothetical protein
VEAIVTANNAQNTSEQAVGLISFTPTEARAGFPGHGPSCLCGARLPVVVASGVKHYRMRCLARQQLSLTSLPERPLDYAAMAQASVVRNANASKPSLFFEKFGEPGAELHHWTPKALFLDFASWPTSQLCSACHQRWHDVMRVGAGR